LGALFDDTGPVFDRGEIRSAVLRRDREVFEGEKPFEVIAHADHTAETSASGGPSPQSGRAYCYDAVREKKLHNIPLIIDRGQSADQMANAI
jgi:hypothetical protein